MFQNVMTLTKYKFFLILLTLLLLGISISAQNSEARKIDSIDSFICDDLKARVDNYFEMRLTRKKMRKVT